MARRQDGLSTLGDKKMEMHQSGSEANSICCTAGGFVNPVQQPDLGTLEKHKIEKENKKVNKERTCQHSQGFLENGSSVPCLRRPETATLLLSAVKVCPVKQLLLNQLQALCIIAITGCKHYDHRHVKLLKPRTYPSLVSILQQQPTQQIFLIIFVWFKLCITYAQSFSPERGWESNISDAMV